MRREASTRALVVVASLVGAGCNAASPDFKPQVIYLVPENFTGWVCVDFDIKGAPPLPREGQAVVIRAKPGAILETSDPDDKVALAFPVEAFVEVGGARRPLPEGLQPRESIGRSGPNEPTTRTCRFIGTIDQRDAAGNPPGFDGRFADGPVAAAERAALVALFEWTGGSKWTHHVGWLGPPGTECRWHGVHCGQRDDGQSTIIWLDLADNNLRGAFPEALGGLAHLESLSLYGNQLSGRLPDALDRRWASGALWMTMHQASWLTDVTAIQLENDSSGASGAWRRVTFNVDGRATMFTKRRISCEVKEGEVFDDDFARLARFIEESGYDALSTEYSRGITHAAFEITSVTRNGKTHTISDYASAGPLALWAIRQAIAGLAESTTWARVRTQPQCPAPFVR